MNTGQPARARIETDWMIDGIRAMVGAPGYLRTWDAPGRVTYTPGEFDPATQPEMPEGRDVWLRLTEDEARALYEALAEYFGGTGHDTRALRKDYDAERQRVDRMLGAFITLAAPPVTL